MPRVAPRVAVLATAAAGALLVGAAAGGGGPALAAPSPTPQPTVSLPVATASQASSPPSSPEPSSAPSGQETSSAPGAYTTPTARRTTTAASTAPSRRSTAAATAAPSGRAVTRSYVPVATYAPRSYAAAPTAAAPTYAAATAAPQSSPAAPGVEQSAGPVTLDGGAPDTLSDVAATGSPTVVVTLRPGQKAAPVFGAGTTVSHKPEPVAVAGINLDRVVLTGVGSGAVLGSAGALGLWVTRRRVRHPGGA